MADTTTPATAAPDALAWRAALRDRIYDEIETERLRQDAQWGGPAHDDGHPPNVWRHLLFNFSKQLLRPRSFKPAPDYRQRLIKIAALAVAAAEVWDRKVPR